MKTKEKMMVAVGKVLNVAGAVLLVALMLLAMLLIGFVLGSSGFAWLGAAGVVAILGFTMWRMLR